MIKKVDPLEHVEKNKIYTTKKLDINTNDIKTLKGITDVERLEKLNVLYLDRCIILDAENNILTKKLTHEKNVITKQVRAELKEEVTIRVSKKYKATNEVLKKKNEELKIIIESLNRKLDEELFFDINEKYVYIKTRNKTYSGYVQKETRSHLILRTTNIESYEYVINKFMIQGMKIYRYENMHSSNDPGMEIYNIKNEKHASKKDD
jgi:hypothetical protein